MNPTLIQQHVALQSIDITHRFHPDATILSHVSISLFDNEILSIVGPSGCGKTTLLRILAGLLQPTTGEVIVGEKRIKQPCADVVLLFQEYGRSLLPWRNVVENIEFGLEAQEESQLLRTEMARSFAQRLGLEKLIDRLPGELSGGQQQRVALARALVSKPKVLLMDEPFGALDAQARADLEDALLMVKSTTPISILIVTHDIDEAIYLGHRIILLTSCPTSVQIEEEVSLGERDQISTRSHPKFINMRNQIYTALRSI